MVWAFLLGEHTKRLQFLIGEQKPQKRRYCMSLHYWGVPWGVRTCKVTLPRHANSRKHEGIHMSVQLPSDTTCSPFAQRHAVCMYVCMYACTHATCEPTGARNLKPPILTESPIKLIHPFLGRAVRNCPTQTCHEGNCDQPGNFDAPTGPRHPQHPPLPQVGGRQGRRRRGQASLRARGASAGGIS